MNVQDQIQAKIKERLEAKLQERQMAMLNNDRFIDAKVNAQIKEHTTETLKALEAQCEDIIASTPIMNRQTRENRKWNPSRQYGYGNQMAILSGLLTGIQYSAREHKEQLLALTGLSEDLIEQTIEALGQPAYYSMNYDTVVEETPVNLELLMSSIALIEDALNIQLDTGKLNQRTITAKFDSERLKAEKLKAESAISAKLQGQVLNLDD